MIHNATNILNRHFGKRPAGWMGTWIAEALVTPDLVKEADKPGLDAISGQRQLVQKTRR